MEFADPADFEGVPLRGVRVGRRSATSVAESCADTGGPRGSERDGPGVS